MSENLVLDQKLIPGVFLSTRVVSGGHSKVVLMNKSSLARRSSTFAQITASNAQNEQFLNKLCQFACASAQSSQDLLRPTHFSLLYGAKHSPWRAKTQSLMFPEVVMK